MRQKIWLYERNHIYIYIRVYVYHSTASILKIEGIECLSTVCLLLPLFSLRNVCLVLDNCVSVWVCTNKCWLPALAAYMLLLFVIQWPTLIVNFPDTEMNINTVCARMIIHILAILAIQRWGECWARRRKQSHAHTNCHKHINCSAQFLEEQSPIGYILHFILKSWSIVEDYG